MAALVEDAAAMDAVTGQDIGDEMEDTIDMGGAEWKDGQWLPTGPQARNSIAQFG